MKKTIKLFGITALVAVIGFTMITCDNGTGGKSTITTKPVPQTVEYSGTGDDGSTYTLKITENTARYAAQVGDSYELTVTSGSSTKKSSGTVTAIGNTLELTPSGGTPDDTFTIAVTTTGGITAVTGKITFDDGTKSEKEKVEVTPTPGSSGTPDVEAAKLTISNEQVYLERDNYGHDTATWQTFNGNKKVYGFCLYLDNGEESYYSIGESGSITNGKLSFEIGTPSKLESIDKLLGYYIFGPDATASDPSAKLACLALSTDSDPSKISTFLSKEYDSYTDSGTDYSSTYVRVEFIYVDKDVTIAAPEYTETFTGTFTDDWGYEYTYNLTTAINAFSLTLKAGWNTLCVKEENSETITEIWDDDINEWIQTQANTFTPTFTLDNPDSTKWMLFELER